jgi:hypothetical protein
MRFSWTQGSLLSERCRINLSSTRNDLPCLTLLRFSITPLFQAAIFFPRMVPILDPYWVEAADGSRLACYYRAVHPDAKTVVYFHGNGEVVADYLPDFPEWLARAGCN